MAEVNRRTLEALVEVLRDEANRESHDFKLKLDVVEGIRFSPNEAVERTAKFGIEAGRIQGLRLAADIIEGYLESYSNKQEGN